MMVGSGGQNGSYAHLFTVQGIGGKSKGGGSHFNQMGNVVLAAGGGTGVAHELHGQAGKNERVGELLKG